jgi:hypothetical protein
VENDVHLLIGSGRHYRVIVSAVSHALSQETQSKNDGVWLKGQPRRKVPM